MIPIFEMDAWTGGDFQPSPSSRKRSHTGAIAGGIIGGVVGFGILAGLVAWHILRRRRLSSQEPVFESHTNHATSTPHSPDKLPKLYVYHFSASLPHDLTPCRRTRTTRAPFQSPYRTGLLPRSTEVRLSLEGMNSSYRRLGNRVMPINSHKLFIISDEEQLSNTDTPRVISAPELITVSCLISAQGWCLVIGFPLWGIY